MKEPLKVAREIADEFDLSDLHLYQSERDKLAALITGKLKGLIGTADEYFAELDSPVPDYTMRKVLRDRLRAELARVKGE